MVLQSLLPGGQAASPRVVTSRRKLHKQVGGWRKITRVQGRWLWWDWTQTRLHSDPGPAHPAKFREICSQLFAQSCWRPANEMSSVGGSDGPRQEAWGCLHLDNVESGFLALPAGRSYELTPVCCPFLLKASPQHAKGLVLRVTWGWSWAEWSLNTNVQHSQCMTSHYKQLGPDLDHNLGLGD